MSTREERKIEREQRRHEERERLAAEFGPSKVTSFLTSDKRTAKRVTGKELAQAAAKNATPAQQARRAQRFKAVLAGALVLASGVIWFSGDAARSAHALALEELEIQRSELAAQTQPLVEVAETEVNIEMGVEAIESALGAAEQVALAQNAFGAFDFLGENPDWSLQDDIAFGLTNYFDEASQLGAADPTREWFVRWVEDPATGEMVPAPTDSYGWVAQRTYVLNPDNTVDVTWLNRDTATGELLAWAQGTYDYMQGVFTQATWSLTSFGTSQSGDGDGNNIVHDHEEA